MTLEQQNKVAIIHTPI